MGRFLTLTKDMEVKDTLAAYPDSKSIILWKPVQSGKTSDVLKLAEVFYKTSAMIFISDKNTSLAGQTNGRAKVLGFEVVNYRDDIKLGKFIRESVGKKRILHLLMEVNNLEKLESLLDVLEDTPVTIVIDEADKSRNTEAANKKKAKGKTKLQEVDESDEDDSDEDEETIEKADGSMLPPVTLLLLQIKNMVKEREDSRTIFVSATPAAVLTAEKDDWLVLYKEPYQNYVGVGINHPAQLHMNNHITENSCKARDRWTGSERDIRTNTFYHSLSFGVDQFCKAPNRSDEEITQLMLVSLENRKLQQFKMACVVEQQIRSSEFAGKVSVVVFNSDTKENSEVTLASLILQEKLRGFSKVIVIAGFMASRGVSFTDFSDKENKFELILQVHYTKRDFPLNSSMQNMRIFGPARRTVSRPALICNSWAAQDVSINFSESYRIIQELAENGFATQGAYNPQRPLTQPYNFRYLKQGWVRERFIYPSTNEADHLPIVP
jgi:hypothetical protein